jgi:AcrR family transcriptional regulator
MAAEGSGKRTVKYHSPLRARQAAETRRSVIDAALTLFQQHGWAATTLPMIARGADVSVDTIYASFGTKSAVLLEAFEVALVGDDDEAAMADRPDFAQLGQGRRWERLRVGVRYTMDVYERSVPIISTLREAAASDEVARARLAQYDRDRRELIAAGMALILGADTSDDVVDAIYALVSPEVYTHLIEGCGWTPARVEDWFVDMAKVAITRARH